ncbi:MAG: M48 family metallopeptidase [Parachlamydiaceae bacterium]
MYFGALFVCHYAQVNSTKKSLSAVRFLIPLVVPFVCFIFLSELEGLIPLDGTQQIIVLTTMNIAAIVATFIFFPTLLMLLWGCPKLENSPCTHELGELCHRANFKYSSFRLWEVMDGAATAAIVGIFGRFRYILFSRDLFSRFPPQAIKAVLAHEIGHSYHRHLLIYPFIFSGMIVLGYDAVISLYNPLFGQTGMLVHFFAFSSDLSWVIVQFVVFSILILAIALYFRFVFGYFSRLFERQADLHVFAVGIEAEDMIKALDLLGAISGNTHDEPNWHHYSIRERILFLQEVINNPTLIEKHHRHVRYSLIGYSCILMLFFAYFIVNIEVFL